ncbi:hypothetical protein A3K73_05165 [Candidatus Pacearchaeota archaeon RBG_13_36_9]|nr:MAG: hypothetical protein A3K73_05165 [Candidatus Pacearchaeota archaeon RBG_13_36_9]
MLECPRCFWLHHNKDKKRPEGIFPSLPNGMDIILKKHFDKFMEKGKLPPEIAEEGECVGCKLFEDKKLLDEWRNNRKGIAWADEKGNVLHGAIDNLLVKSGKLIVLDYKTRGFPCKDNTHEHYQLQLDVYAYLLQKNGYKTEDFAFLLFYHPKEVLETGEVIFDTTLKKMKIDVNRAEKTWKEALRVLNGKCPKKHEEKICPWCELLAEE